MGSSGRKPTVALVTWKVTERMVPSAEVIRRAAKHIDFVVVSSKLEPTLEPIVRWRRVRAPTRAWSRLTWAVFFLGVQIRMRGVRTDLVHTMGASPSIRGRRIDLASLTFCHSLYHAELNGRPRRGLPGLWRLARRLTLGLERSTYRPGRVRMLAAECPSGKRTLEHHFPGIDVTVVPTPIDTTRFRPDPVAREEVRRSEGIAEDEMVALFVGRDLELKGLDEAIGGLAEAARLGHGRIRLWVLGAGNIEKYEGLAAEAGVADRVCFFGIRADIERFYPAADLLLLPTLCEMFCRAAYEAAASGIPVVGTRVNGVSELVGAGGEAGLFVERDAGSVGRALARLAADPDLRRRLGEEGRKRALECTVERTVEGLLQAYDRLLAEKASDGRGSPVAIADHPPER